MMKIKIFLTCFLLIPLANMFPQDTNTSEDESNTAPAVQKTIEEERIEILKFGIDSEVLEVLTAIRSEKTAYYNDHLLNILSETRNKDIQELIFFIFTDQKTDIATATATTILNDVVEDQEIYEKVAISAIAYLGEIGNPESADILYDVILMDGTEAYQGPALRSLSKIGDDSRADELLTLLEEMDYEDETEQITSSLILTLGELKYHNALPILLEIAEDQFASITNRQYACVSLGKINDPEAIDVLINIYDTAENSYLRAYALSGLAEFKDDRDADGIIIQALKRDSFWRVRVAAAEGIGERQLNDAYELLVYKSERDPIPQVRQAAFEALGKLGNNQSSSYLLEYFQNKDNPPNYRLEVLKILVENKIPGTINVIESTFQAEWANEMTKIVEYSGRILSTTQWRALKPVYNLMLTHPEMNIKLYAIRGIKLNEITESYQRVRDMDQDGANPQIRREASGIPAVQ